MGKATKTIKVGITIGDFNGIGPEVILKAFDDKRMYDLCIPIVYGSLKVLNHYKKLYQLDKIKLHVLKDKEASSLRPGVLNIVQSLNDETVTVEPGQSTDKAGESALMLIDEAVEDLQSGYIDAMVTGPINKNNIKIADGKFTGHTEYITRKTEAEDSTMFLVGDQLKMGLVTNHLPISEVAGKINTKTILAKLNILNKSLQADFAISGPKIAVLALNPHAGDNGLLGKEEKEIIIPAIKKAKESGLLAFGPYPADGFMGSGMFKKFDAALAMYHDQGLVAFKSLTFSEGVNFTAGIPIVRTSPDHGTAYDIAGKNEADPGSIIQAIFAAVDIARNRQEHELHAANPLKIKKKRTTGKED